MLSKAKLMMAAFGLLAGASLAQPPADASIEDLVRQAEARAGALKARLTGVDAGQAADRASRYEADARALAAGNRERLRQGMTYLSPEFNIDPYAEVDPAGEGVIYIAVSLSMPKASLRELARDANAAGATLVIQGLVGNSFVKTRTELRGIFVEGEAAGLIIDPRVFRQFGVTRVPSFIVAPQGIEPCEEGLDCKRSDAPFDVVRGNISLRQALTILSDKGDAAPQIARTALARLGG